jgi:hypothetical protein
VRRAAISWTVSGSGFNVQELKYGEEGRKVRRMRRKEKIGKRKGDEPAAVRGWRTGNFVPLRLDAKSSAIGGLKLEIGA